MFCVSKRWASLQWKWKWNVGESPKLLFFISYFSRYVTWLQLNGTWAWCKHRHYYLTCFCLTPSLLCAEANESFLHTAINLINGFVFFVHTCIFAISTNAHRELSLGIFQPCCAALSDAFSIMKQLTPLLHYSILIRRRISQLHQINGSFFFVNVFAHRIEILLVFFFVENSTCNLKIEFLYKLTKSLEIYRHGSQCELNLYPLFVRSVTWMKQKINYSTIRACLQGKDHWNPFEWPFFSWPQTHSMHQVQIRVHIKCHSKQWYEWANQCLMNRNVHRFDRNQTCN